MARTIDVVRHTDNDGDALSDDGIAAAMQLGRRLSGDYTVAVSTGSQRTTQTIACVLAATGRRIESGVIVEAGLRSDDEDRWREAYKKMGSGELAALREADTEFVQAETGSLGVALQRVLHRMRDGEAALVVGHSPMSEAAVFGLTGVEVDPFGKGAGVRVVEDAGEFVVNALP